MHLHICIYIEIHTYILNIEIHTDMYNIVHSHVCDYMNPS